MRYNEALLIAGFTLVLSGCFGDDDDNKKSSSPQNQDDPQQSIDGDSRGRGEEAPPLPELTETTGIAPTADRTPTYQFESTEAGLLRSLGACQFADYDVVVGLNTITLDPLVPGTYSDCVIEFYQDAQRVLTLPVSSFTILETVLTEATPVGDTLVSTPAYEFTSNAVSEIRSEGDCSFAPFTSIIGTNTLELDELTPGIYSDCTIKSFQDGLLAATLDISDFTVHAGGLIEELSAIGETSDYTPDYSFQVNVNGDIRSAGACSFTEFSAATGPQAVSFNLLSPGTYSDCEIELYQQGVLKDSLNITDFQVVDTVLTEVTLIGDTLVSTPTYEFTSNAVSEIRSEGDCSFAPFTSIIGTNTLELDELTPGVYSDCTINSFQGDVLVATLSISDFTVHAGGLIEELGSIGETSDYTPDYPFQVNVNGDIRSAGACSFTEFSAATGPQAVSFNLLSPGTYSDCKIELYQQGILKDSLAVTEFTIIDTVLTEVTQIGDTRASTPTYKFTSNAISEIRGEGACQFSAFTSVIGVNTLEFNELTSGIYSDCTIKSFQGGLLAATLDISDFTVHAGALIEELSAIGETSDYTPDYPFQVNVNGEIRSAGLCSFTGFNATTGPQSISFDLLSPGTYSDCKIELYQQGVLKDSLDITDFQVVDTVLTEVTLIGDTLDTTPVFEFISNAFSEIRSEGACQFAAFTSVIGVNTLEFNELTPGIYSDCTINSFQGGLLAATLDISDFTVYAGGLIEELGNIGQTSDYTPDYPFQVNVSGEIRSAGSCSFTGFNATTGSQSISFDPLAPGTYSDCKIELYQQGILKDSLAITEFTILPFAPEGFVEVTLNDRAYKLCPHTYIVPDARDPLFEDPDADGWGEACEVAAGTDPNNADSDGDGFIDAADEHPLNPMLPDPSGVKSCSAGEAFDITFEMPLPSVCSYNHCTQGVNYGYGEDLSGGIKLRLQVPENFNGSMVFNETHNRTSWLTDPDINNPTTDAYFTFENPAYSALLDEGFALVSPLSLATPEGRFDFPEALMPSRVEMIWGHNFEWAQQVIEQAYCSDATSSLLLGSGLKSRYIHTRVERTYPDSGRTATHFDGVVLADGFYASLVTLGDVWLFHNLAFFYSEASWFFGDLNAPESTIPASSIGFYMVFNYAAAFTDFVRVVAGHPDAEHWRASGLQQVFGLSLYSLNKLNTLGGAALASNAIPNTVTHTLTTEEVLLLDGLGLDTEPALTNLNNAFVAGVPPGRAIIDSYDFVGGNLQVPAIFHVNPMNLHSMSAQSASLYEMMLESKGKSHLLRLHVSTSNSDMPDSDPSVLVNEMNLLKTWVEDGIAPPLRGGDTEYVLPEWRMTPIPTF